MKIILFSGSLRKESLNGKLVSYVKTLLAPEVETELLALRDYDLPVYDGDLEAKGIPEGVKKLAAKIAAADALIVSTPEYNGSIPGSLKNAIDWVSRIKPVPLNHSKQLLLLAASPGALGGIRSLWHTRVPFEALGVHVFPQMFGLSGADQAFDADGKLKDAKKAEQLSVLVKKFVEHVG